MNPSPITSFEISGAEPKPTIKLLCITDSLSEVKRVKILAALGKVEADYAIADIDVSWEFDYRNLSTLKWVTYNYAGFNGLTSLGVDFSYLASETKKIRETYGDKFDCVVWVIDESNWKQGQAPTWGWNLGEFFNSYQVELVMVQENEEYLYKTFSMEIFHAMNDFVRKRLGVDIAQTLGVGNFDEDVVHGKLNPPYVVFEYRPTIARLATLLQETFSYRKIVFPQNLRYGMKLPDVKMLQDFLKKLGFFPTAQESTGYFGWITLRAVIVFQRAYGIFPPFGFVGTLTRAKLNEIYSQ